MLMNPNWDKSVTLANFVAFLETKPADQAYNYLDPRQCAVGQFSRHLGIPDEDERPGIWRCDAAAPLNDIARGPPLTVTMRLARSEHWTFGACLERAKCDMEH